MMYYDTMQTLGEKGKIMRTCGEGEKGREDYTVTKRYHLASLLPLCKGSDVSRMYLLCSKI